MAGIIIEYASRGRWGCQVDAENEQQKREHGTYARPRVFGKPWHKNRVPKRTQHPEAARIREMLYRGSSIREIAEMLGISKSGMYGVINNRMG